MRPPGIKNLFFIRVFLSLFIDYCVRNCRPIARIFRRGVTWTSDFEKHAKLGGSGGMVPQEIFRN